ncbi:MAG: DegT/DnrJ/EryC1/StrS family aminotransferase [Cellvibrionaceae bacterium]
MESFGAMMLADLPPAGDRIDTSNSLPPPEYPGYRSLWLNSGTAALALALLHARRQLPNISTPQVIIPAYGCPDLVAAAVYAGVTPVVADIGLDDPGFDLEVLRSSLNSHTIAVMAVNFLGIRERVEAIKAILPPGVFLLEDNAQWHPELNGSVNLLGDYVITSFGRGKPASVLGGGLLLLRDGLEFDPDWLTQHARTSNSESPLVRLRYRVKTGLYNLLRQPRFYYWLNRNPFLNLGETRYKPVADIGTMTPSSRALVAANVRRLLAADRWREKRYDGIFADLPTVTPLALKWSSRRGRLLRYPLVCDNGHQRDRLLGALQRQGLGASAMYRRPLLSISGVAGQAVAYENPRHAEGFARSLLTLPVHSGVSRQHIDRIGIISREIFESG